MSEESSDHATHADWRAVGSAFSNLGDQMRSHFRSEDTTPGKEQADGAAIDDFRDSVAAALSNLQAAINDPSVDKAAKTASDSLLEALKTELDSSWGTTK